MVLRFLVSALVYLTAMTGLGFRLAFLHIGPHEERRRRVMNLRQVEKEIKVKRGRIVDCVGEGNILAMDLAVRDVCVDPTIIEQEKNMVEVSSCLSDYLGIPSDEVAVLASRKGRRYERVSKAVPLSIATQIANEKIEGIFFREDNVRYYPQRSVLCHVLGFVNHEGVAGAGLEQSLNKWLRGSPGVYENRLYGKKHPVYLSPVRYTPALAGADIQLTIDQNIQHIVEKSIDQAMEEYNAEGAWIIVQRVRTGEIVAMASRPGYDLNEFNVSTTNQRLNRAVGYVYEPGSTFKAIVFAAALNEGIVTPDRVIDCENGAWRHCRRILRDYHPYGKLTVADGLKKSSNILTAKVALMLGEERFYKYLKAFGIGDRMGLEVPGEESGILHPLSGWSGISTSRIAIGQGVAVTALQMLGVYCAIANDGYLMKPYVVKRIIKRDGEVLVETHPKAISRTVSPETARTMRHLLHRVTEKGGTGRRAAVEGFMVGGKTGTAQKPIPGGYSETENVASFVGFLPADNPELGIIVVVDNPQPIRTGGMVAAPVFKRIAEESVRCLGVVPSFHAADRSWGFDSRNGVAAR